MFLKKKYSFKISMIGAGNVSSQLAPCLESAGHAVMEVFSRDQKNARRLCEELYHASAKKDLDFSQSESMLFILAVPDDAIREVAERVILPPDAILMHTSGSTPLKDLKRTPQVEIAVFYPLQTFSKNKKVNFEDIPILIEANNEETLSTVKKLAGSISKSVFEVSSEQRSVLHIAAVFASNFTNHMISLAEDLTKAYDIDFELLKPLVAETINKSLEVGAKQAQTGPAIRADFKTLERHHSFLKKYDKQLARIYKHITDSILSGKK